MPGYDPYSYGVPVKQASDVFQQRDEFGRPIPQANPQQPTNLPQPGMPGAPMPPMGGSPILPGMQTKPTISGQAPGYGGTLPPTRPMPSAPGAPPPMSPAPAQQAFHHPAMHPEINVAARKAKKRAVLTQMGGE